MEVCASTSHFSRLVQDFLGTSWVRGPSKKKRKHSRQQTSDSSEATTKALVTNAVSPCTGIIYAFSVYSIKYIRFEL